MAPGDGNGWEEYKRLVLQQGKVMIEDHDRIIEMGRDLQNMEQDLAAMRATVETLVQTVGTHSARQAAVGGGITTLVQAVGILLLLTGVIVAIVVAMGGTA